MLTLYNTLSRKKEIFSAIGRSTSGGKQIVSLYTCGPTVYNYAHIGNLRTFIFEDILRRVLEYVGYRVKHVMNITDVGHLTGDRDMGEDKLEEGAKRERKSAWDIAKFYTKAFLEDIEKLNIEKPDKMPRATDYIPEQIKLVKDLERKGYTYKTSDGIYFDTSKLKDYGKLAHLRVKDLEEGARVEKNPEKKNPADFALWKFAKKGEKRQMEWDSPWGKHSFPGWHVECSVLATKFLGQPFDIHTGGVDHISVHHTNEIAQSEAAYGKPLANYWLHGEFLVINKERMGKSERNFLTLQNLIDKGFNPLVYRYFTLGAHYRSELNFTWKAISAAENALHSLYREVAFLGQTPKSKKTNLVARKKLKGYETKATKSSSSDTLEVYRKKFLDAVSDDLNMPRALSVVWGVVGDKAIPSKEKRDLVFKFDRVLGLRLKDADRCAKAPAGISKLAREREALRNNKQFVQADKLRKQIDELGYTIDDTEYGPFLWPKKI